MKNFAIILCVLLSATTVQSQIIGNAGFAIGADATMITIGAEKQFNLLSSQKLHINPGLRVNMFSGKNLDYITAPANLTAEDGNIDTIGLSTISDNFANLYVHIKYDFSSKLSIGFDIDLLGVSFGGEQKGDFTPGANGAAAGSMAAMNVPASPTSVNYLVMADLDNGSLNSTLTLSYKLNDNLGLDLGGGLVFTEYTSTTEIGFDKNDRFRNKSFMGYIGISYVIMK
ncbi:MAG: hypothetical protein ACI8ZN_000874 [Bacteroidia bacterium]|jgi:hypothetical protein